MKLLNCFFSFKRTLEVNIFLIKKYAVLSKILLLLLYIIPITYFFIAFTKCGLGFNELAISHDSRMAEYIWYCPCGAGADVV